MAYTENFEIVGAHYTVVLENSFEFIMNRYGLHKSVIIAAIISSSQYLKTGENSIYDHDHQILIRVTKENSTVIITEIDRPDIILDDVNVIKS